MKTLTVAQAAYIAAFVDGEGCIGVNAQRKEDRNEPAYRLVFQVSNTQIRVLTWMRDITGIGIVEPQKVEGNSRKAQWVWRLSRKETEQFLPVIMPYLKIKLRQAELVLEFAALPRGPYSRHNRIPQEVTIQRKLIWEDLRELNRRGL